jgi:hypothetical protein
MVDPASLPAGMRAGAPRAFQIEADPTAIEDVYVPVLPAR